jgi:hypothetical protein
MFGMGGVPGMKTPLAFGEGLEVRVMFKTY